MYLFSLDTCVDKNLAKKEISNIDHYKELCVLFLW